MSRYAVSAVRAIISLFKTPESKETERHVNTRRLSLYDCRSRLCATKNDRLVKKKNVVYVPEQDYCSFTKGAGVVYHHQDLRFVTREQAKKSSCYRLRGSIHLADKTNSQFYNIRKAHGGDDDLSSVFLHDIPYCILSDNGK